MTCLHPLLHQTISSCSCHAGLWLCSSIPGQIDALLLALGCTKTATATMSCIYLSLASAAQGMLLWPVCSLTSSPPSLCEFNELGPCWCLNMRERWPAMTCAMLFLAAGLPHPDQAQAQSRWPCAQVLLKLLSVYQR